MSVLDRLLGRDPHSLAAPYALDALDPDERQRFQRHLRRCAPCTASVRTLTDGAVRLAWSVATPAPDAMRERVLTAVRTLPQQESAPPVTQGDQTPPAQRDQRPERTTPARGRRARGVPLPASFAFGAAVVALAAAVLFGVQALHANDQLDQERAQTQAIARVLAAPDAQTTSGRDKNGRGIGAVISTTQGRAVVTVTGLSAPPSGKVHQLWLMRANALPRSLGLLDGTTPLVATGLKGTTLSLAVTTEPDGGSAQPTTAPIAQLALE